MTPPISPGPPKEERPTQSPVLNPQSSSVSPSPPRRLAASPLNLRARLIVSHAFVILLALALVLLLSAAYLRRYETTVERERIEQLADTLTISTNYLARQASSSSNQPRIEAIDALADEQNVRLIVFGRAGQVLYDSDETGSLTGHVLPDFAPLVRALLRQTGLRTGVQKRWIDAGDINALSGSFVLLSAGGPGAQGKALAV